MEFPKTKKERVKNLYQWTFLLYGREKIGKSVVAASFPDVVFIPTEPGLKDIESRDLVNSDGYVKSWEECLEAIKLVEDNKSLCKVVCIDTADRFYDMCVEYICKREGIKALGLNDKGKKDYGVSWDICNKEFIRTIHRLICVGKGVVFTSHSKNYEDENKQCFIKPTMSNKCRDVIEPIVDCAFYGEKVVQRIDGKLKESRVWLCEGNAFVWAGARYKFPKFLPMVENDGYKVFERAFNDPNYKGIPDTDIIRSIETNKTFEGVLNNG